MPQNQSKLIALVLSFLVVLFSGALARADSLGISVAIVPYVNESGLSGGGNDRLWFPIEPGQSLTREIRVTSYSELRQVVSVQLFDYVTENGVRSTDFSSPSGIFDWVGEDAIEGVLVEPGETITLPIPLAVPSDAAQRAYEGTLRVLATEFDDGVEEEQEGGVRAIVQGAVAIDLAFWVGVGDALTLLPSFDIVDIEGVLLEDLKYLRIYFENTGLSPVRLRGSAQFSDPQFAERVYDPASYVSPQISPGERGFADVLINQEIIDGDWSVFVLAEQDGIRQTRLFEGNLRFAAPGSVPNWVWVVLQIAIGLLSLAGAVFGLRALRSGRTSELDSELTEPTPKRRAALPRVQVSLPQVDLTRLLEPVRALVTHLRSKAAERAQMPKAPQQKQTTPRAERPKKSRPSKSAKSYEARVQALMNANQVVRDLMGEDIRDALFQAEMAEKYPQGNYSFDFDTLEKPAQDRVRQILDAKRVIRELQTDELRIEVIRRETDAKLERMRQATGV
jgi:hypothetical protein